MRAVRGWRMRPVPLDDHYTAAQAAANATTPIIKNRAVAPLLCGGTAYSRALLAVLMQHPLAMVGPATRGMALHTAVDPLAINRV